MPNVILSHNCLSNVFSFYTSILESLQWHSCVCMCALSRLTLCDPMDYSPPRSSVRAIFQARNTEVGCHFLLQGIFLSQGLNPCLLCLLNWQVNLLPPHYLGSRIVRVCLLQVRVSFSRRDNSHLYCPFNGLEIILRIWISHLSDMCVPWVNFGLQGDIYILIFNFLPKYFVK